MCQYSEAKTPPCTKTKSNIGEGCKWCNDARKHPQTIQYSDIS